MTYYFIILSLKMKTKNSYRPPGKKSPSPIKSLSPLNSPNTQTQTLYFCHYRNAMYMGGVKNFKKEGKGILLHDNGLSVICFHLNDVMHGHNIFYSQHCLLSAEYNKGKLTNAVYRTDGFLSHLLFNNDEQLDGKCKLLNYTAKTITYAVFKKGVLLQKTEETQFAVLNRVFDLRQYELLIGRQHHKAIKYDIEKENFIEGQKHGNKLTVGFEKGGSLNGLGFTIIFKGSHGGYNPETHRNEDQFELKVIERGYMQNSQLTGFGEKLFKNGNLYTGEFKNGIFEGNGLLRNGAKKNWVSGYFQKGNLVDLFEYNNEGGDKKFDKIVQSLHQRKTNWINNEIALTSMDNYDHLIQKIVTDVPSASIKTLEQRKQEVLKKIQENFICDSSNLPSFLQTSTNELQSLEKGKSEGQSIKHFVQCFIPEAEHKQREKQMKQNKTVTSATGQFNFTRKLGQQDIRKSKIFNQSSTPDKYMRISNLSTSRKRVSRTPEQKKKIFTKTVTSTQPKTKSKEENQEINSPEGEHSQLSELKIKDEHQESGFGASPSEDDFSNSEKDNSRMKSARRSKIFSYLQDKSEEISPKFIYTKVDTLPESQKRKRMGLDQQV